jgi:hypothetical protein
MSRDDDQPGLRLRLTHASRRIAGQHDYLDALVASTLRALERNTPAEAREGLEGFAGALDAHFALEEQLHFPALHGLRPEVAPEIEALMVEHRALRARVRGLGERVGREPRDEVTREFVGLADTLRDHESREEQLFASIEPAPEPPPRGSA